MFHQIIKANQIVLDDCNTSDWSVPRKLLEGLTVRA